MRESRFLSCLLSTLTRMSSDDEACSSFLTFLLLELLLLWSGSCLIAGLALLVAAATLPSPPACAAHGCPQLRAPWLGGPKPRLLGERECERLPRGA